MGGGRAGLGGSDARGDGGGSTNVVDNKDVGGARDPIIENVSDGTGGRISVSPAGRTFFGDPSEIRDWRAVLLALVFAGGFLGEDFFGDLKAPLRGDCLYDFICFTGAGGSGSGEGGRSSSSILSISQARFSSRNLTRSAYKEKMIHREQTIKFR
jgi:hypothetical protein